MTVEYRTGLDGKERPWDTCHGCGRKRIVKDPDRHLCGECAFDADHGRALQLVTVPTTAEMLEEVRAFVLRFMVLPSEAAADVIALWVLHAWAFRAAVATPYLRIVSATADSGKTQLLELLAAICPRGWHAVNPSTAVLYRKIDAQTPTLLVDELDNYPMNDRRDALSVLNSGYKAGARVDRATATGDLESFSCFCPKAFAGIDARALPTTLLSRSITIRLERKARHEHTDRWMRQLIGDDLAVLTGRCDGLGQHDRRGTRGRAAGATRLAQQPGRRGVVVAAGDRRARRPGVEAACARRGVLPRCRWR